MIRMEYKVSPIYENLLFCGWLYSLEVVLYEKGFWSARGLFCRQEVKSGIFESLVDKNAGIVEGRGQEVFKLANINRVVTLLDPTTRKEVRKPISEYASSHMARRTFCGNVYKNV